jgi:hypothetical protein
MKIENIIRRVLREQQEEEKLLKIPGIRFFNNDWNLLQKFLESQGYPRYSIGGDLDLRRTDIESLGNLVRVEGYLDLRKCQNFQSLGNLEYVDGHLNLYGCENLQSLGDLEYVGSVLNLAYTSIESLGNLVKVDGNLDLASCKNLQSLGDLEYVGGWLNLHDTPIRIKYTEEEIRNMVEVDGKIYLSYED